MRVLYFNCMEITKNNNIHQNQVFGLANKGVDYHFYFLSPMFIITRSGFSINLSKSNKERVDTSETIIPLPSPMGLMYLFLIPLFLIVAIPPFYIKLRRVKPQIVHCRALLSAFLAVCVRKVTSLNYKIVCDPRSVYVEECVIHGAYSMNSFNYRGWKKIERRIYRNSDVCIGLSEYFSDYLKKYNHNSYYVPALVQDDLMYDKSIREEERFNLHLSDKDIVFTYIGSIGKWHSIELYIDCLKKCQSNIPKGYNMKIILLTGNQRAIKMLFENFSSDVILKTGQVPPQEVKKMLCASDYGIVPGSNREGYCYDLLYATMIASKAEEFLASGLPVIVNSRIASLAKMVYDNQAGFSFTDDAFNINFERKFDHFAISTVFNQEFRASKVVGQYNKIYQEIV